MKRILGMFVCAAMLGLASPGHAQTLATVKARGALNCGSNPGLAGFGLPDAQGNWTGLDIDFCRAVAAAIFDDPKKVKFVPLTAKDRFTALQSGEIDVLARNTTWTSSRDSALGLNFTGVNYYDGQGFMVRKELKVKSALELSEAAVCVGQGTTTELNLADYFRGNKMKLKTVTFATNDETVKAYEAGRCDVFTTDSSGLYGERLRFAKPDDHVVLPEIISKEPLGPSVRHGDDQWFDIVKWVHYAMLNAEEADVTSKNIGEALKSENPDVKSWPAPRATTANSSGSPRTGWCASSSTSATTARCSSATSAKARRSRSNAASTRCGPRAACNTPHRLGKAYTNKQRSGAIRLRYCARRSVLGMTFPC